MTRHTRYQGVIVRDHQVLLIKNRELDSGRGRGPLLLLFSTLFVYCCISVAAKSSKLETIY